MLQPPLLLEPQLRTMRSGTACDPGPRTPAIRTASDPGKLSPWPRWPNKRAQGLTTWQRRETPVI
eukprot:11082896-Alexandrium_andersonii.AAC.1